MPIIVTGKEQVDQHLANLASAIRDLSNLSSSIGTPVAYAEAVHEGSRARLISAVNRRALWWAGASHPVRSVAHPGNAPNRFLHDTFIARRNDITASISTGITQSTINNNLHAAAPWTHEMEDVLAEVRDNTPVGQGKPGHRAGTLRDSFHVEFFRTRGTPVVLG